MGTIIRIDSLTFEYVSEEGQEAKKALDGVSLVIESGSFTAVIGRNGSGKSTLAKNLNGLLVPTDGVIYVKGWDTADDDHVWDVRRTVGMVFQNPDNQIVSSIVEDDVAFGPENLGVEASEIRRRVDQSLEAVNMGAYRMKAPNQLSGGQKQRIAIAGVCAMEPECIVFDEPTAMLDPKGRSDVMKIIRDLHSRGITVILITHFMEEAAMADRIVIMSEGSVLLDGSPKEVFREEDLLRAAGMDLPLAVEMASRLRRKGVPVPQGIVSEDELVEFLCQYR